MCGLGRDRTKLEQDHVGLDALLHHRVVKFADVGDVLADFPARHEGADATTARDEAAPFENRDCLADCRPTDGILCRECRLRGDPLARFERAAMDLPRQRIGKLLIASVRSLENNVRVSREPTAGSSTQHTLSNNQPSSPDKLAATLSLLPTPPGDRAGATPWSRRFVSVRVRSLNRAPTSSNPRRPSRCRRCRTRCRDRRSCECRGGRP